MDQQKVEALAFRMVADMAASFSMALGHIGDRLGMFRAMKDAGPLTSEQLDAYDVRGVFRHGSQPARRMCRHRHMIFLIGRGRN